MFTLSTQQVADPPESDVSAVHDNIDIRRETAVVLTEGLPPPRLPHPADTARHLITDQAFNVMIAFTKLIPAAVME